MGRDDALTDMDRNPGDICEGDADERLSLESLKNVVGIAPLLLLELLLELLELKLAAAMAAAAAAAEVFVDAEFDVLLRLL